MLKINKNILAIIMTGSLINIPTVLIAQNKTNAYYESNKFVIQEKNSYTLEISKEKLEELINSDSNNNVKIIIGNKKVEIDKQELIKLKKQADQLKKEYEYYLTITYTATGAILIIITSSELKKMTKVK